MNQIWPILVFNQANKTTNQKIKVDENLSRPRHIEIFKSSMCLGPDEKASGYALQTSPSRAADCVVLGCATLAPVLSLTLKRYFRNW